MGRLTRRELVLVVIAGLVLLGAFVSLGRFATRAATPGPPPATPSVVASTDPTP